MATIAPHVLPKAGVAAEDEEQLLKLFRNRAELKKEFDQLRAQSHRLNEQLKQQEARTLRLQQRLQQLEANLGNPEKAQTIVAYYHLKAVWEHCHERLASMSRDVEKAQYDTAHRQHVAAFQRRVNQSIQSVQQELKKATEQGEQLSARIKAMREQRSARRGLWNFIRRRRMTAEINAWRDERRLIRGVINELSETIRQRTSEEPPEFSGLTVPARRDINLALIALAQELYLHFADRDLARLAREASIRQATDVAYGNKRDCRALAKHVEDRMALLLADSQLQSRVQVRTEYLRTVVQYRRDEDTVPIASGLGIIALLKADGRFRGELPVNVLADEYWDVFAVLLT